MKVVSKFNKSDNRESLVHEVEYSAVGPLRRPLLSVR